MDLIRRASTGACLVAAVWILGACSHNDSANSSQDQSVAQSTASEAPAANGDASDAPAASGDASATPSGACRLIDSASVEKAMHDNVDTVSVDANSCDFSFKTIPTHLTVEFDAQGGADDLDLLRKTVAGATGAMNGAASAAPGGSQMVAGVISPGSPSGVPNLGDDQFASGPTPALFLGVRRGDTYVQISGAALPDGVDPWAAATELVRDTFVHQH